MSESTYTVGELRAALDRSKARDDVPVVVHVWGGENEEYVKAYATRAQHVHDFLPDSDGGDDIHNTGFVLVIEGELPSEEEA